jgi:superfamily II DNA or RNA helicase
MQFKEGIKVSFYDKFQPRPFQAELISVVMARSNEGQKATVAWVSPGSGKTLAYQAAATELFRTGVIATIAIYAPRTALAEQCEIGYKKQRESFDPNCRFERITHKVNEPPLTEPGAIGVGFVSTYSALSRRPNLHLDWARRNAGKFLLVVDEAQFCGCDDDERNLSGTSAATNIEAMAEYAAHVLVLTGTPRRSDKAPIAVAEYRTDETGKKWLEWHVKCLYAEGVDQGYLREFEIRLKNADVARRNQETDLITETQLSEDASGLSDVLECESVWKPLVDSTVNELKDAQKMWPGYKALIACKDKASARKAQSYIRERHGDITSTLAISGGDDDAAGRNALRAFKFDDIDILVTVRKAFVGYDCNRITVVGCLTNYRDHGHLEQLIGRGLRVDDASGIPPKQQRLRIVAPDDPAMVKFLEYMREQVEKYIPPLGPDGPPPPNQVNFVEGAVASTERVVVAMGAEFDSAQLDYIDKYRSKANIGGPVESVARILDQVDSGWRDRVTEPKRHYATDYRTDREIVADIKSKAANKIAGIAARNLGVGFSKEKHGKEIAVVRSKINAQFGISGVDEITTVEQAYCYLDFVSSAAGEAE